MDKLQIYSYDNKSIDQEVLDHDSGVVKICVLCGKSFLAKGRNSSRMKICGRVHYRYCEACGQQFEITDFSSGVDCIKRTCSRKCTNIMRGKSLKKSMKEKYGVENPSQVSEFKEKARKKLIEKSDEIKEKREKTMIEKYGAAYPMQIDQFREKIFATNLERYGYTNPVYNVSISSKISEMLKSEDVIKRYEKTCLERYGVTRPSKLQSIQDKMKETCIERYGTEYPIQNLDIKHKSSENHKKSLQEKYGVDNVSQIPTVKEKIKETNIDRYGVPWYVMTDDFKQSGRNTIISKTNIEFAKLIQMSLGLETEFEFILDDMSYDLHVLNTNILIEINPSYTHNCLGLNHWNIKRNRKYHLSKSELAIKHGYRCIHIFDWDNIQKVLDLLYQGQIVYARKCILKEIDTKIASEFCDQYHLQGKVTKQKLCFGLFYDNELIQVMTFGKPRYNKNFEWELLRLCTNYHYKVVGGAERLFKAFIKKVNPKSVISYCDIAKFDGKVYERLGMKLHHKSDPSKIWSKNHKYITENLLLSRGYDQLFNTNYGKGTSNIELMIENGWLPVYDCGQYVYTLDNSEE